MTAEACGGCRRPMVRGAVRPAVGEVLHHGLGMCRYCYQNATRVQGTLKKWGHRTGEPDEAAVLRVVGGERLPLSVPERLEVTRILTRHGKSAPFIARQIGVAQRTVTRYRRRVAA